MSSCTTFCMCMPTLIPYPTIPYPHTLPSYPYPGYLPQCRVEWSLISPTMSLPQLTLQLSLHRPYSHHFDTLATVPDALCMCKSVAALKQALGSACRREPHLATIVLDFPLTCALLLAETIPTDCHDLRSTLNESFFSRVWHESDRSPSEELSS